MTFLRFTLLCGCLLLGACTSSTSPIVAGAKAMDHGLIGAGEGPAWQDGYLYFIDGKDHINRMNFATGRTTVFKAKCGNPNGLLFDPQGRLIACQSNARRLVRYDRDGHRTILAGTFHGMKFNSPNDVTMDSQGRIYFTDPRYGPRDDMELRDARGHLVEGVYRVDAPGKVSLILSYDSVDRPNGILVSPGDRYLYICDNDSADPGAARKLVRFDLNQDGTVAKNTKQLIYDWKDSRGPDGMKMDRAGRIYVCGGRNEANDNETNSFKAGCYILSPRGSLITFIPTAPDEATNCAFGGEDRKTLCITSGQHLWTVPLTTAGWQAGTK